MSRKRHVRELDAQHTSGMQPAEAAAYLTDPQNGNDENVELSPDAITRALQDAGELVAIQAAAASGDEAAIVGVGLLRTARDYGMSVKLWPDTADRSAFDAMVTAGLISAPTAAAIITMATRKVSLAEAAGLSNLDQHDIVEARA